MKWIHCEQIILAGDFKVFKDVFEDEYICCLNATVCNECPIE